jgi:hypothetical protein
MNQNNALTSADLMGFVSLLGLTTASGISETSVLQRLQNKNIKAGFTVKKIVS